MILDVYLLAKKKIYKKERTLSFVRMRKSMKRARMTRMQPAPVWKASRWGTREPPAAKYCRPPTRDIRPLPMVRAAKKRAAVS